MTVPFKNSKETALKPRPTYILIERKGKQTMATVDVKGKTIEVDEDGFLANLDDWSMDVANYFAQGRGY